MILRSFVAALVAVLALGAAPAQAVSFDYLVADYPGQSITENLKHPGFYNFSVEGDLADHTQIAFTYALQNTLTHPAPGGGVTGVTFMVNSAIGPSNEPLAYAGLGDSMTTVDGLLLASASLSADGNSGTALFRNLSDAVVHFSSLLTGVFMKSGVYNVTWNVTSVPLPGALPLFGLGMASLAAFAAKRRKTEV